MQHTRQAAKIVIVFLLGGLTGFVSGLGFIVTLLWREHDQTLFRLVARFNKRWTNRLAMTFAGRKNSPYAVIRHVGRRSGRLYATPVIVGSAADGFIVPLAYGDTVDWYRNILAAKGCTLEWQGNRYAIGTPEPVDTETALSTFPRLWQKALRRHKITRFIKLVPVEASAGRPIEEMERHEKMLLEHV